MSENTDQTQKQPAPTQQQQSLAVVHWEPETATEAWTLAKYYQQSNLLPKALANIGDVFVTIAAGRDFGWSPMQSMRGIYVVEGKPSLSADAMVGIAKKSTTCEYFVLIESTAKIATYETKRRGDPKPTRMSFSIEEAALAGLAGKKGPWQNYPARMLRNRCKSALCKEVYEELFFGTYEEGEVDEIPRPPRGRAISAAPTQTTSPERELNPPPGAKPSAGSEPAHDPQTGEVNEHAAAQADKTREPDADEEPLADTFAKRIAACPDATRLSEVGADIKLAAERGHIIEEERARLMKTYLEKLKSFTAPRAA